uniref:Uncharacterized protein n=1 Tax=Spongospora subterranea TaxID=70186 RepID=A0A0H5QUL1_9EUKA|eukprot:CRZ05698.1 hypothetical protein [Spongospora subterranea]
MDDLQFVHVHHFLPTRFPHRLQAIRIDIVIVKRFAELASVYLLLFLDDQKASKFRFSFVFIIVFAVSAFTFFQQFCTIDLDFFDHRFHLLFLSFRHAFNTFFQRQTHRRDSFAFDWRLLPIFSLTCFSHR